MNILLEALHELNINEDILQEAGKGELLDDWFTGYQIFYIKDGSESKLFKIVDKANDAIELAKKLSRQADVEQVDVKPVGSEKNLVSFCLGTDTENRIRYLVDYAKKSIDSESPSIDLCIRNLVKGQPVDFNKYSDDWILNLYKKCSDYAAYSSYKDSYIKPKETIEAELKKRNLPLNEELSKILEEINLKALVCPNCGGTLTKKSETILKCPYCDSEFLVQDTQKQPEEKKVPKLPKTNWYAEETILDVLNRVETGKAPSNFALYFDNQKLSRYYDICLKYKDKFPKALAQINYELDKRGLLIKSKTVQKDSRVVRDFKTEHPEFKGWRGR